VPINYREYHPKWKKISWFIRQFRAKQKCEWCGADNGFSHPITGSIVVLTVAHLDYNKNNNSFFNLKALCQKCHLGHDLKRHVWERKYGNLEKQGQQRLYGKEVEPKKRTELAFNRNGIEQGDRAYKQA
jgi:hypothetical protein